MVMWTAATLTCGVAFGILTGIAVVAASPVAFIGAMATGVAWAVLISH